MSIVIFYNPNKLRERERERERRIVKTYSRIF